MAYPFQSITREVYRKTFLRDVHMVFYFDSVAKDDAFDIKVKGFLKDSFGLDSATTSGLEKVVSKDKTVTLEFGTEFVKLSIKRPEYRSYEDDNVKELKSLMFKYIHLINVKKLTRLEMSKFNQLRYSSDKNLKDIIGSVFCDELSDVIEDGSFTRLEKIWTADDEKSNSQFTIEYGFRRDTPDSKDGFLTLKTKIESTGTMIAIEDIENRMEQFNQILDEGFHWCVKPEIINLMKQ